MSGVNFWSKLKVGSKYWNKVSEHCQHLHDSIDQQQRSQAGPARCFVRKENLKIETCMQHIVKPDTQKDSVIDRIATLSTFNDHKFAKETCGLNTSKQYLHNRDTFSIMSQVMCLNNGTSTTQSVPHIHALRSYSFDAAVTGRTDKSNKASTTIREKSTSSNPSVLDSMGIDRTSDTSSNDGSDDNKRNDGNEQKDNDQKESTESAFLRSQRYAKWMLLGSFGIGAPFFILTHGAPSVDERGEEVRDQYSDLPLVKAYLWRAWGEIKVVKRDIVEPSANKLLPDPLQEPYYQPPYTLVIELMDIFLRPVYDSVSGWRFKKRPGIDYFLAQVGPPLYEIIIFTKETGMTAYPLIESMDQKGYIMYRLFRDAARYKSGFSFGNILEGEMPKLDPYYQKDLKYLNRDLKKVIIIDCEKRSFELQPENGLCLEKWDGSTNDSTLYDLAGLLRAIASSNVDDVRPVLKHYSETEKPIEAFKLAQARMQQDSQLALRGGTSSQLFAGATSTVSSLIRRR